MSSTLVDSYTVACPFPDCGWTHTAEILDYYPPPMVEMFTNGADSARERHLSEHDGPAWAAAYEQAVKDRDHWDQAADRNGQLYSACENQRDDLRAARDRTIARMEEYSAAGSGGVNPRQVINLLSLSWPDGNYEAAPEADHG